MNTSPRSISSALPSNLNSTSPQSHPLLHEAHSRVLSEAGAVEEDGEEIELFIAILFPFFALALGIAVRHALKPLKKVKIPYTAVLLVVGILLGIWQSQSDLRELGESLTLWININPEVLLYGFLPVLVFASGIEANVHIFFRVIWQCILLAGPGVALGAFLTAVVFKYIFYDWSWNTSMVVGSILAATDPVAVVALLNELGASPRLSTVIEGESLLNDGIAIVFFNLFLAYSSGRNAICYGYDKTCIDVTSAGGVIRYLSQVALGGPAIGIAFALGVVIWVNFTSDVIIEISLTVATAYLAYFVADFTSGTSGVLAVVTAGVLIAYLGKPSIVGEANTALEVFWEIITFIANTIIFVLAGLIIGYNFLVLEDISGKEWGFLVALYFFLYLIRAIVVVLFYPLLMRMGYGLSAKEGLVLVHGGLRGAVGLALAILVNNTSELGTIDEPTETQGNRILFFVGGIATMTLLINAPTTEPLMQYLGMFVETKASLRTKRETLAYLQDVAIEVYSRVRTDSILGEGIPAIISKLVPNLNIGALIEIDNFTDDCSDYDYDADGKLKTSETTGANERKATLEKGGIRGEEEEEEEEENEVSPSGEDDVDVDESKFKKFKRGVQRRITQQQEQMKRSNQGENSNWSRKRISEVLNEQSLIEVGCPPNIKLEDIRPYLADLEIRFLNGVAAHYVSMRTRHLINSRHAVILKQSVDYALDTPEMVNDWTVLRPFCATRMKSTTMSHPHMNEGGDEDQEHELPEHWKVVQMLDGVINLIAAGLGLHLSVEDIYLGTILASSYLKARKEISIWLEATLAEWPVLPVVSRNPESSADELNDNGQTTKLRSESAHFRARHDSMELNSLILKILEREMEIYDVEAERYLAAVRKSAPHVLAAVKSEQVAAEILHGQEERLEALFHEGLLMHSEYSEIRRPIHTAIRKIHRGPKTLKEAQRLFVNARVDSPRKNHTVIYRQESELSAEFGTDVSE